MGINDQGHVIVQSCDINFNCRAALWQDGVMTDLNTLTPVLRRNSIGRFSTQCNIVTRWSPGLYALSFGFLEVTDLKGILAG
jgi:probable HAF family extracellular repeat protein